MRRLDYDCTVHLSVRCMRTVCVRVCVCVYAQALRQVFTRHPGAFAFVATNDPPVVTRLSAVFPGRILSFAPSQEQLKAAGCNPHTLDAGDRGSEYVTVTLLRTYSHGTMWWW